MNTRALTLEQTGHVQAWTAIALQQMPYMASMLFSLRFVDAPGLGTFAVDRHHRCYIDFDAVAHEGPVSGGESLLHECMHLFGAHAEFADDLGITGPLRKAWNLATDASINDDLRDAGSTIFVDGGQFVLPSSIGQPDYQTAQTYFEHLCQAMAKKQQGGSGPGRPGQGQPGGQGQQAGASQGQPAGQGQQPGQGQGAASGAAQPGPYKGCGSGAGGESAPCELDPDNDLGGHAPAATTTEKDRVRIATATAIRDAAAKGRGTVPGGLVEHATFILTPSKVPWQRVLGRMIRGCVRSRLGQADTSFTRRNARRHNERILTPHGPGNRLVIPGSVDPVPYLVVIRDTSGSMNEADENAVTNEVVAIAKKLRIRGENLVIVDVDAAVHTAKGFTSAKAMSEIAGRGGTDMVVGIEWALARKPKPTAVVVMTDGETPWPAAQTTRIPVIAVIVHKHAEQVAARAPSWIRTVCVEPIAA